MPRRRLRHYIGSARQAHASILFVWQFETRKPRPEVRAGRCGGASSVSVPPLGARPDEGVAVALLVVGEVGVDRGGGRVIVQHDREVVTALGGPLRPGGPDLGAPDIRPVAGSGVVR